MTKHFFLYNLAFLVNLLFMLELRIQMELNFDAISWLEINNKSVSKRYTMILLLYQFV